MHRCIALADARFSNTPFSSREAGIAKGFGIRFYPRPSFEAKVLTTAAEASDSHTRTHHFQDRSNNAIFHSPWLGSQYTSKFNTQLALPSRLLYFVQPSLRLTCPSTIRHSLLTD
jgi:hypothetical protein